MPDNTVITQHRDRPEVQLSTASAIMPVGGSLTKPSKVLIVDDEPNIALVLQRVLGALPNISAISTQYPLDALSLSSKQSFDIVITDYQMPEVDGLTLANRLHKLCPKTKIIILTAHDDIASYACSSDSPIYAVVTKPVAPPQLREFVLNILSEESQATQ